MKALLGQAHRSLGARKDRRTEFAGASCSVGKDSIELGRIAAKLIEALADRPDQTNQRIGECGLERPEPLTGELLYHLIDVRSRHRRKDSDQVFGLGTR